MMKKSVLCDTCMNIQLCEYAFYASFKCFILPVLAFVFFTDPVIYNDEYIFHSK